MPSAPLDNTNSVTINFVHGTRSAPVRLPTGGTIDVLLQEQGVNAAASTTRVNGQAAQPGQVLRDGDRVVTTPAKVAGARR